MGTVIKNGIAVTRLNPNASGGGAGATFITTATPASEWIPKVGQENIIFSGEAITPDGGSMPVLLPLVVNNEEDTMYIFSGIYSNYRVQVTYNYGDEAEVRWDEITLTEIADVESLTPYLFNSSASRPEDLEAAVGVNKPILWDGKQAIQAASETVTFAGIDDDEITVYRFTFNEDEEGVNWDLETDVKLSKSHLPDGIVRYDEPQTLTETEQAQARSNINAPSKDGYYQSLSVGLADKAGDLDIDNGTFTHKQTVPMETTGGSDSLRDGEAKILKIYGTTDGISAAGAKVIGSSFNLIPSGNGTTFIFLAVKGEWGQYKTATKNNGYLFVSEGNVILTPASVTQNGVAVPTHTEDGKTFYLPPADGEVTVTFATAQNNPCGHICWSNERDIAYSPYNPSIVDVSGIISAMGGVLRKAGLVVDEIDFTLHKSFQRLDEVILKNLTWTMTEGPEPEEGQERVNIFRAFVSGLKSGGTVEVKGVDGIALAVDGTDVVCNNTATSVSAFVALLGNGTAWYEKASVTERTFTVSGDIVINDYGITIFTNTEGVSVVDIEFEFRKNWRDDAKNLPQTVETNGLVTAHALNDLYEQLLSPLRHNILREDLVNEFQYGNWTKDKVASAKLVHDMFDIFGTQTAETIARALIYFREIGSICAGIAPAYQHGDGGAVGDIRTWNGYLWKCDTAQSPSYDLDETKWHKTTLLEEFLSNQN